MLRRLLRAPCQAAGSAALTALAVSTVLEALASRCGFVGFGGLHMYGDEAARKLRAQVTVAT